MSLDRFINDLHAKECAFKLPAEYVQDLEETITEVIKSFLPKALEMIPGRFTVQEIANAGSHFERTKIKEPNEYDFMVVIKELSQTGAIILEKGCKNGYVRVKVTDQNKWDFAYPSQTPNMSFETTFLQFNLYIRQALQLTTQISPFKGYTGQLRFKNILSRGKQYKEFSYVQTAYFRWEYNMPISENPSNIYCPEEEHDTQTVEINSNKDQTELQKQMSDIAHEPKLRIASTTEDCEVIYDRSKFISIKSQHNDSNFVTGDTFLEANLETLDVDVDLMTCCHVPLHEFAVILPDETLENPLLLKNGCHIVLKPCGNPKCILESRECRLISYTKSEQELMCNLSKNWKVVFKWIFGFTEILGVDSYKLKTAVLHISKTQTAPGERMNTTSDIYMLSMWRYLKMCSSRQHMPSYFNHTLNVWNIAPYFSYLINWEIKLLCKIFERIDETPLSEYDYETFRDILEEWIVQFSKNNTPLKYLEATISRSDFSDFCVQGNVFVGIVRGMEPVLRKHKRFRNIGLHMKCHVMLAVIKVLCCELLGRLWRLCRMSVTQRSLFL